LKTRWTARAAGVFADDKGSDIFTNVWGAAAGRGSSNVSRKIGLSELATFPYWFKRLFVSEVDQVR
jgi:hypothetical protein